MGATPWLSVLVPVHNVAPYLRELVASVMSQADEGVELLLLDDASTDGSAALMQTLQQEHGPCVRLLQHEHNQGVAAARNHLLDAALGQYVWFVDADDWLLGGALPALRALLQPAAPPDVVLCDFAIVRARSTLKHRLRGEGHRPGFVGPARQTVRGPAALLQGVLASGNVFVWTVVARRSLWGQDLRFPTGRCFEDMATVPRLLLRASTGWHAAQPWVAYRRRDGSILDHMSAAKVADLSKALVGVRAAARQAGLPQGAIFALDHQCARNYIAARRHALRLPRSEQKGLLPALRADFDAATEHTGPALLQTLLRRGWWLRWWRLRAALA